MSRHYRILHLDTERTWRGGQQQAFLLASGLARRGHSCTVVCPPGSPLSVRCRDAGLRVIEVHARGEWDLPAVLEMRRILVSRTIHILHAHNAHGAALGAMTRCPGLPAFVISRRVDFPIGKNPFSRWKYRVADKVIAISEGVKKILLDDGIPENKIAVAHSGLDLEAYNQLKNGSSVRAEWRLDSHSPLVGVVAALAPHKDHKTFLEAVKIVKAECPEARYLIVGDGALKKELEGFTKDLGLSKEVIFTGFRQDALAILRQLDVAVLSSATEGMGTVLLEAMVFGRPIAATRTGGIPEIVEDGQNGLLAPPHDPQALARNILKILQDKALAKTLGEGGRKKVVEFSVDNTAARTEAVYNEVMGSKGYHV